MEIDTESERGELLGWNQIRKQLKWLGYQIAGLREDSEFTIVFNHPYVNPDSITNPNHAKVVRALIEAHLSTERITQTEIAKKLGYKPSAITMIKQLYLRAEEDLETN